MLEPHAALDHLLIAVIAVVSPLADWLWVYPALRAATAAGVPGARARFYRMGLLTQWGLTACVLALWAAKRRPWSGLSMGSGTGRGAAIGAAIVIGVVALLLAQRRAFLARADRLDILHRQVGSALALLPHTPAELLGFRGLAITAGICEEILYRGYVFWYVAVWLGAGWSVLVSSILFGLAHIYLDGRSAVRAGIVGAIMALVVWATGSLWWAMILHAAVDLNSGDLAFRILGGGGGEADAPVGAAPAS